MRHLAAALLAGSVMLPVANACAAPPDKTILGIELGSRFLVPECIGSSTLSSRLCINTRLTSRTAWGADEYYVALPRTGVPPYVRGELKVVTVQGIVESVQVGTWGLQSQGGALTALTNQFGKPTRTREQKKAANSRFAAQFAEWDLEGFSVKLDGTSGSIDWGSIEVSSHRYQKLVKEHEAGQVKLGRADAAAPFGQDGADAASCLGHSPRGYHPSSLSPLPQGFVMPVIHHDAVPHQPFSGGATYQTLVGDEQGSTTVRVGIQTSPPGYRTRTHSHPYMEVLTVLEGSGESWIEGSEEILRLEPGVTLVFPANTRHWFRATGERPLKTLGVHASARRVTEMAEG